jgi:hypothetical protein
MGDIKSFPSTVRGNPQRPILRPCDYGLFNTIRDLETQLGTIEAYNRLVAASERLKKRIDAGDVKAQNPLYAVSIKG